MELEILWTQFAEHKLQDIFTYYLQKAGLKIAQKIVTEIIHKTDNLVKQPGIGALEPLLAGRPQKFRYLVSTNFKIIYYFNKESQRIVIVNVFDTRQNPVKIQETTS